MNICPFRKYQHLFGIEKKGVHKYRLLGTPMVDYILTLVVSFLTTYLTKLPLVLSTIVWFIIGIILHILFNVKTNTLEWLGIKCS